MKKMILIAMLAGVATPAFAQDVAPVGGARVAVIGGLDLISTGARAEDDSPFDNRDGALLGVQVGYDMPLGSAFVGVEGEVSKSQSEICDEVLDDEDERLGDVCLGGDYDLYIGGRIGTRVTDNMSLYAKGGYTRVNLGVDFDAAEGVTDIDDDMLDDVLDDFDANSMDGYRVGAGVQFDWGSHGLVSAEYRYSNYSYDIETHQVVLGLGYRF